MSVTDAKDFLPFSSTDGKVSFFINFKILFYENLFADVAQKKINKYFSQIIYKKFNAVAG